MTPPRKLWLKRLVALALLGFAAVNVVAWLQVRSMTTWRDSDARTQKPSSEQGCSPVHRSNR